eukprot:jgi/Ulvmu1/4754/UM020_0039.1
MLNRRAQSEAPCIRNGRSSVAHLQRGRFMAVAARSRNVSRCASVDIGQPHTNGATPNAQMEIVLESSQSKILTAFTFPAALSASHDVALTGSFNGWKKPFPMRPANSSDLVRSVLLPPGTTEYKFVVDGEWRYSPRDPVVTSSSQGTINNCKVVQENCNICWQGEKPGQEVFVTGSFLGWSELVPLAHTENGRYTAHCCLPNGQHFIRFLVDSTWQLAPGLPSTIDETGVPCNVISVDAKDSFRIYYESTWEDSLVKYRLLDEAGAPVRDVCYSLTIAVQLINQ